MRPTLSVAEAADMLGVSPRHVYNLVERGVLAKVPDLGRKTRIPRLCVDALVASAMPSPVPPGVVPTRLGSLSGDGIGAAALGRSGKSSPAGRSTSTKDDGPLREQRPVEDSGALSTAARR